MKINPCKPSSYTSVKPEYIAGYIREYSNKINTLVNENDLAGKNKTRLKSVAANLETVLKELEYMINGRY